MLKGVLTRRLLGGLAVAGAIGGGVWVGTINQALADYTPPALVDGQTFLAWKATKRLRRPDGGFDFACHAVCRSAETGGARPRACNIFPAMDAGTFAGADIECLQEAAAGCTAQAVGECADPVAQ